MAGRDLGHPGKNAAIWRFSTGGGRGTGRSRIEAIFQDARELQADALEMLAQGRIRNALITRLYHEISHPGGG